MFLETGARGLKTRSDPEERELTLALAKIGELMMRLELAEYLIEKGASDPGYGIEVVSPATTIRSWPGLRIRAERSYRDVRGPVDTLILTGTDTPDDALRDGDLIAWLAETAPRTRRLFGSSASAFRQRRVSSAQS